MKTKPVSPVSILSLSQRPRILSDLYGQESIVAAIRAHMSKRPPRTWLLSGPPGTGKTTVAKIMSVAYQCTHSELWGDPCVTCRKARSSFAIHEINASKVSGVEELEKVAALSLARPMSGLYRVIVLDEVQKISSTAWSMLLDFMEQPPEFTVWIMCTSEPAKVPAANQRRAVRYQFRPLSETQVKEFVTQYAAKSGIARALDDLIEALSVMSVGSPGIILQALEKYDAGASGVESVSESGSKVDTFRLCKAVTSGNWNGVKAVLREVKPDDVRWVRAAVAGWIRNGMLRQGSSNDALSLAELTAMPFDDTMMLNWLVAALYRITVRYK